MQEKNTELKEGYSQVVVWPATSLAEENIKEFEGWIEEELGARCQFLEVIVTTAGMGGSGGRDDLLFAIHDDKTGAFATQRLKYGMRWFDDVVSDANQGWVLYPKRVMAYKSWGSAPEGLEA